MASLTGRSSADQDRDEDDCDSPTSSFPEDKSQKIWPYYKVPVIGPLLQKPPLLIGNELFLDPPTPLQWKTIEECVEIHATCGQNATFAFVDAAPLVAILDESAEGNGHGARYATLAAIVGVTAKSSFLDTSDASSFRESLHKISSMENPYATDGKVRLYGIGRASLKNFDRHETSEGPILMARLDLVQDGHNMGESNESNQSPVHALAAMSQWASRIAFLHSDRQKLIQGLQAANTKLELASQDWEDHDGIGALFASRIAMPKDVEGQNISDQVNFSPNKEFQEKINQLLVLFAATGQSRTLSPESARLLQLNNFGLGYSPASFVSLDRLTKVAVERLKPYYSPQLLASEEFYYSIYSFVALASLQSYLDSTHLAWAMNVRNTVERLEKVFDWMHHHKQLLKELAESKIQELRDCGEECTDFW